LPKTGQAGEHDLRFAEGSHEHMFACNG
jgi:hypothetical protein